MFRRVLVANRGEILARITRTLRRMGIETVAVYAAADRFSPPVLAADHAEPIGPSPAAQSYLDIDAIIAACRRSGAEAVHPGYGFLAERAAFAEALAAAGIAFIGPGADHLRSFGLKHTARALAAAAGVPLLEGSGILTDLADATHHAARIGYPVMLKSSAGGGGIGMAICRTEAELAASYTSIAHLARANFGDAALFLESYVERARHVEVQIFGDGTGTVKALGCRDCSLQRRNQKLIEESPPPNIPAATIAAMEHAACALAASVGYRSAGTVEFIYDADHDRFHFLEVNTRLQVEHGVTEAIYGIDLVAWMIELAAGTFTWPATLTPRGAAIEARLYAEDPANQFRPATGRITALTLPNTLRIDHWIEPGTEITPFYDPTLAKLIASGPDRATAIATLDAALAASTVTGLTTNRDYLRAALALPDFVAGTMTTASLTSLKPLSRSVLVIDPGAQSSLQSAPGRLGYWHVGIPPSGPMDRRSATAANALLGNPPDASVLECTMAGPTLLFRTDATIALTGTAMAAAIDGEPVIHHQPTKITAGQTLTLGVITGPGQRCYLAVAGGFEAAASLGSTATFTLGGFGGHATGALRTGDVIGIATAALTTPTRPEPAPLTDHWTLTLRSGPHGAPDFFTPADIETIFTAAYEVHHNSARTGIRLIGPKPAWARADGGEAGLHPSNIHDTPYAIGAVDFTGDMPILLGPDGPSLGGFVCPGVVTRADLWKLGQLRPGDTVRFARADAQPAIILHSETMTIRRAGDENLLVEFGPMALDFALRLRAHALQQSLQSQAIHGLIDLTPGIRSLQIHFDPDIVDPADLVTLIASLEPTLPDPASMVVPSRLVHLPLSWKDAAVMLAMRKYQDTVREDAPWCPDNVEFIRRINGLTDENEVRRIVFEAEYLVLGLGDVYLGAPVATPLDPRHRLITTKYNPARTWTPENAVGIGGAYLCVYGMEGPGGYQLFGRTIQMWNSFPNGKPPFGDTPWLLRPFDRLKFHEVTADELAEARAAFPHGRYPIKIEDGTFSLAEHQTYLADHEADITRFQHTQRAAFEAERTAWAAQGLDTAFLPDPPAPPSQTPLPPGAHGIDSPVPGSVWQILHQPGDPIDAGQPLMIVESMKMEIKITAPTAGILTTVEASPGQVVRAGQRLAVISAKAGP
ncbi:5-oxoprolinase/urea amidolyase family protein [Acidiphilium sp. PA]|uniref:5-oxoprolinase/urea amidolyase family protein n=1 Tax=Acidiphilium sp. PA TaxID=2871705 RepID=UPI0022449227|nr:5-oxoprolinase/urea amidolyase family protein [Acidiphilium sp. PA]MCW8307521.1 5-oxoprolinase/urea amidolyase family protein [Acidiphilium sp. PA]